MSAYDDLVEELKVKYRAAVENMGEGPARRAFFKATMRPAVRLRVPLKLRPGKAAYYEPEDDAG